VDVRSVATVIDTVLAPGARFAIDGPIPLDADVAARLARITVEPADGDELLFRVSLDIDVEVARPKAADNAVLIIVLRVQTVLRVSTLINPAALRVTFQPVSPEDVRLLQVRGKLRGGWLPLPGGALSRLVRRRIADELNRRFHDVGRHIVIAELVANRPPER
jgi:hypothetical protein